MIKNPTSHSQSPQSGQKMPKQISSHIPAVLFLAAILDLVLVLVF